MKTKLKIAFSLILIIGLGFLALYGQSYNALLNPTYLAAGGPQTTSLQENSIIAYHKLVWTVTGSVATCSVTVDTSPDGTSWSTGGAITAQTCTTTGNSGTATNVTANFIRINASTLSGTGSVQFTYTGFTTNPSPGGGSGNTTTTAVYLTSAYTNATTSQTNLTDGSNNMAFAVAANTKYTILCNLIYQASNTTGGLELGLTGPAAPTALNADFFNWTTPTANHDDAQRAYGGTWGTAGTFTATQDFAGTFTITLLNGPNAGTVQVKAQAAAAGTVTVQPGGVCRMTTN